MLVYACVNDSSLSAEKKLPPVLTAMFFNSVSSILDLNCKSSIISPSKVPMPIV